MFKVGDKVRLLSDGGFGDDCKVGDIAEVLNVDHRGVNVDIDTENCEKGLYFYFHEVEIIEEEKEVKFKVGDKVVRSANVTNSADDHGAGWTTAYKQFLKGDVCEVIEKVDDDCRDYIIKAPNGNTFGEYEENLKLYEEETKAPIASDGGSSSYYDKEIPQWLLNRLIERNDEGKCFIKTEELIEVLFRNDFSFGNAFKALVRADGVVTGQGKAGNTLSYETTKVKYYANRILEQGEDN